MLIDLIDTRLPIEAETSPTHGLVFLPNAQTSFANTNLMQTLTTYAQGWRDPENYDELIEFLFPAVQVPNMFEFMKSDNSEDFAIDSDDERPAMADFKMINFSGSKAIQKTVNRGLSIYIDPDQVRTMPDWQTIYTGRLLRRIKRNAAARGLSMLLGASSSTDKTWNSASDPDADLMNLIKDSGDLIGFNPNRVIWTGSAWIKRALALRAQETEGARLSLGLTTPDAAAIYAGAQKGKDISTRVNGPSGKRNIAGGDHLLAFYSESGVGPEDPSATKGFWSPCDNGSRYAVYLRQTGSKFFTLTVECYDRMVVTSTLGLKKHLIK